LAAELAAAALVFLLWQRRDVSLRVVVGFAILFRLLFLWLPPVLSDDAYRYIWDGLLQTHGVNPFAHRPSDAELAFLQTEPVYAHLNSVSYYTVYPPLSQFIFRAGASVYSAGWLPTYYVIKTILAACEIGALWLLSRRCSPRTLILYAWNPLVILAAAGQAHTEAAAVLFLVLAWTLADRGSGKWASVALAAAGLIKLYPFVLLPLLWRRFRWRGIWPGILTVVLLSWPFAHPDAITNILTSLDLYVRSFEFNAGIYYGVKKIFSLITGEDWSKQIGPALRWLFLASLPVIYYFDSRFEWPLRRSMVVVLGMFFVCSTTVHPWYLLPLLALLVPAVPPSWHWLWLGLASLGTYLLYVDGPYWIWVILGWGGWALMGMLRYSDPALDRILTARAGRKVDLIGDFTPEDKAGASVLDLGAGEGYVGQELAHRTGIEVTLADVIDLNRTELPHVVYDGRRLPFETDNFDAVLLVYVLHHADSPDAVLNEAARVSAGRIIVLESIYTHRIQRYLLGYIDRFVNTLRSSGRMTARHQKLDFRRFEEWMDTFRSSGLHVEVARDLGGIIHQRALFVLSKLRPDV
jgi:SAM-dependent methyltransferase